MMNILDNFMIICERKWFKFFLYVSLKAQKEIELINQ